MGSSDDEAHQRWYGRIAEHYASLYGKRRDENAAAFLHSVLRRHGPIRDLLDVACGTFGPDFGLVRRGYRLTGRDLSPAMLQVARQGLRREGLQASLAQGDMRSLDLGREFDAVLCLGTAFNYLVDDLDVERALGTFRDHLRSGGLLILDLTNFAAFLDRPMNVRAEVDYRAPDGTRVAVFAFNEQNLSKTVHTARFLTVSQKGDRIDIGFDEARLRVWRGDDLAKALRLRGFRPLETWGDLRAQVPYSKTAPRLVVVARRR